MLDRCAWWVVSGCVSRIGYMLDLLLCCGKGLGTSCAVPKLRRPRHASDVQPAAAKSKLLSAAWADLAPWSTFGCTFRPRHELPCHYLDMSHCSGSLKNVKTISERGCRTNGDNTLALMLAGRTGMSIDGFEHLELTYERPPPVHPKSISFCKVRASTGRMQQIQSGRIGFAVCLPSCSLAVPTPEPGTSVKTVLLSKPRGVPVTSPDPRIAGTMYWDGCGGLAAASLQKVHKQRQG
jgi:hypothetical protein